MTAPLLTALAAAVLVGLADRCNRTVIGFLPDDLPQPGRKQHARPVPLAGIALLPLLLAVLLWHGLCFLATGVAAAAAVGYADDWCKERGAGLSWRTKALALLLAAACCASEAVDPLAASGHWWLAFALAFVLTNATNFLDNTDGVAAAVAGTALMVAGRGEGALGLCGAAALGFLPWNWPRPRLFLGDAGAYALGLCCGFGCASALPALGRALLPFSVQLADFTQVVLARLALGLPPWVGDRRHLTHIAQYLGLPRVAVAPLFAAIAVAVPWIALGTPWPWR